MISPGKINQMLFKKIDGNLTMWQKLTTLFAAMLPLILLLALVVSYRVEFFVWDELALVPFWEKLATGGTELSDWLKPHNDHQILFPKLIMVGMLSLFNFKILPLLILTLVFSFSGYLLIWKVQIKEQMENRLTHITIVVGSFLFFSLLQWENFLRFWQIQLVMCIVFFIWSSYFLFVNRYSTLNTVLALVFAAISTFSFGNGIIGLVVNGVLLIFDNSNKDEKKKKSIIYLSGLVIIVLLFFTTFNRAEGGNSLLADLLPNLVKLPVFFLFFIGQVIVYPFFANKILAALSIGAGFAGLTIFIFNAIKMFHYRKTTGGGLLFLFALSLWVILSAAIISLGRIGFGLETSVSSRYASFSALFWVSNLSLFLILLNSEKFGENTGSKIFKYITLQKNKIGTALLFVMFVGAVNSISASWRFSFYERTTLPALSEYYKMSGNNELLQAIYPDSTEFSKYPAVMAKIGITPFNNYSEFPFELLDRIKSKVAPLQGTPGGVSKLSAEYDFDYKTPFYNMLQGKITSQNGVENADVMVEFKNEVVTKYFICDERNSKKDTDSGFFALISYHNLPKGEYSRRLLVKGNEEWRYLSDSTVVVIK